MARLITIYWRDIPSRVVVRRGRDSIRENLPVRFQSAVNRAAMRAGKGSSQDYIDDWRRVSKIVDEPRGDDGVDIDGAAKNAVALIDASYDNERLEALAKNHGRES